MQQTNHDRAIIALLERLKQDWLWLEHIYIIQGSPLDAKTYKRIAVDTRQSQILKNIPIQRIGEDRRDQRSMAAVWIEAIRPLPENAYSVSVWIIGQKPREERDKEPKEAYGIWLHRKGKVTVRFEGNKASADSLAGLATNFTPFLVPPSGKRVGCSPLVNNDYWYWLNNRTLWTTKRESRRFRFQELRTEGGRFTEVPSPGMQLQRLPPGAWSQFSLQARYFSKVEYGTEGGCNRVIHLIKTNEVVRRIVVPEEQGPWDQAWISDKEWVEYRRDLDKNALVLDIYDVYHTEKVRSYSYPGIYDSGNWFYYIGLSEQGELAFVRDEESQEGRAKIYFMPPDRHHLRTTVVSIPGTREKYHMVLSPNGRLIAWHLEGAYTDEFFTRGSVWVSRVGGSDARLITEFTDVLPGETDTHKSRQFEWRRDGGVLADNWGDCLFSFPLNDT